MSPGPTRPTLLIRLRESDDEHSWAEFVDIYTPMLYRFFVGRGLQDADAADLGQEVMRSVARAIGRFEYDPDKGTFRSWLYQIARNKLNDFFNKRARQPQGSGRTDGNETTWRTRKLLNTISRITLNWNTADGSMNGPGIRFELTTRSTNWKRLRTGGASPRRSPDCGSGSWAHGRCRLCRQIAHHGKAFAKTIESIDGEWPELP